MIQFLKVVRFVCVAWIFEKTEIANWRLEKVLDRWCEDL